MFELWGMCEDLNLSSLELMALQPSLAGYTLKRARRWTRQFTQVRATLRCKTLLLLCGGLASRWAEDELVQWTNNLRRCVLELVRERMI